VRHGKERGWTQIRQPSSFYDLVWPNRTDVLRFARFLCRDPWVAEDLTQETLLKAFRALKQSTVAGTDLRRWLLTILRNTWNDRLRASRSEPRMESLVEEDGAAVGADGAADSPADPQALIEAFSDQQIIDALKALPEEIRWTLLLVDVEGLGVREAAEVLEVPGGTVKSRAHRGRAMLRQALFPLARERRWITDVKAPEETNLRQEES
jgi:RNA polymerase sigma-70 factor (ECF subfamily)